MSLSPTIRRLSLAAAVTASAGMISALGVGGAAQASPRPAATAQYSFTTLDNQRDVTFNQLLGINQRGVIAGYFGSGQAGHPNQGYLLYRPYGQANYRSENFTGSTQTQVTGLNDRGTQVGFWAPTNTGTDANYGWFSTDNGRSFTVINVPGGSTSTPPVTQLLGVNDAEHAVGFALDSAGNAHGFVYDLRRDTFHATHLAGFTSLTDAGINNWGAVCGFGVNASGTTVGFLLPRHGGPIELSVPGSSSTQALGVNDYGEVVGVYTVGSGSSTAMHGFTWTRWGGFSTVDDPSGVGTTTVNGVNDAGDLVGFYVDGAGNTDGMLAVPHR